MKILRLLLPALLTLCPVYAKDYSWTTFAGKTGEPGNADSPGGAARFNDIRDIGADGAGNLYVADVYNHTIRRITPGGEVTTIAGVAGESGSADGAGAAARFSSPFAVAADGSGNVYVADTSNHTIRKITPAGEVTTLAGKPGESGTADGKGAAARFQFPQGITVDEGGTVHVADTNNHAIRRITPAGEVTTIAGLAGESGSADGTGAAARFDYPGAVVVDGDGIVHVADTWNYIIRRITPGGEVTTLAGNPNFLGSVDGKGAAARFSKPDGITLDKDGNVYVTDSDNHIIRKITPAGDVTTLAGWPRVESSEDGTGAAARFRRPEGIVADMAGNLHVADTGNRAIRKITPAGEVTTPALREVKTGGGEVPGAEARFESSEGVAADMAGNVYVADTDNHAIRRITPAGEVVTLAGQPGVSGSADGKGAAARFLRPGGVAVDGAGIMYVADTGNHIIRRVTPGGEVTTLAGKPGESGSADGTGAAARFNAPGGITVDGGGNVYVADTWNHLIRRITPAGEVATLAGRDMDTASSFNHPQGIAAGGDGGVYVADTWNRTIRRITPAGEVTTIAGLRTKAGSADGAGAAARFYVPSGIATGGDGSLYVADTGNHTIRRITPAGEVVTLAGQAGKSGGAEGEGAAARFNWPSGIAVDPAGNLYVADTNNHTIRRGSPGVSGP